MQSEGQHCEIALFTAMYVYISAIDNLPFFEVTMREVIVPIQATKGFTYDYMPISNCGVGVHGGGGGGGHHTFNCSYFGMCVLRSIITGLSYWNGLLDWATVMDYWNGLLDWSTGIDYWNGVLDWATGMDYWTGLLGCIFNLSRHFFHTALFANIMSNFYRTSSTGLRLEIGL